MFEHRSKPVIEKPAFVGRMAFWLFVTASFATVSLIVGMAGYHFLEGMPWIDAFLNASMILGGMGEVTQLHSVSGKLFAGFYAIYCGVFLIVCGGLLLLPVFHRVLHVFHADGENESQR